MRVQKIRHLHQNLRIIILWSISSFTFGLLVSFLPGISIEGWRSAIITIVGIGLLNALLRHLLITIRVPPNLLIFGTLNIVSNALAIWFAGEFLAGFTLSGFWSPFFATLGVAAINLSFSDLLAIDDDDSYFHHIVSMIVNISGKPEKTSKPGILFLEIDGLAEPVLQRAIRDGHMPNLERWLVSGSHKIIPWECDLSSQTSASQAGILQGNNFDIPAFRWYEKDAGKQMVSNHPLDTIEIERRLSNGEGLLAGSGASRGNLFSGDAPQTMFTYSTLGNISRHRLQDFYPLFMGPYNFFRMAMLFLWDLILELQQARFQRRHDVLPRIPRGGVYPLLRASTTILLRELCIYVLIGDMYAGIPVVYATFFGYDEVAHHSGVERPDAIDILHKLDEQFDRLESIVNLAPRPYHFVILSDHGQSQGATFKQRYKKTLEELVQELVTKEHTVERIKSEDAGWGNLSVFLTDVLHDMIPKDDHLISRIFRRLIEPYEYLDQVIIGPYRNYLKRFITSPEHKRAEVIVLASGNLGLIYFTEWVDRLSYEQINEAFPGLIDGLSEHEGIGFIMVRSRENGPMVIGKDGIHYLEEGRVDGKDPLEKFGPNAGAHLLRTDSFPHVADIMVNSLYDSETGEVAAFEELVGSHGGLGGDQTTPFVMFPAEWEIINENIVGACELHAQLKSWLTSTDPLNA